MFTTHLDSAQQVHDPTSPVTDADRVVRVGQLFTAITDWSEHHEVRQASGVKRLSTGKIQRPVKEPTLIERMHNVLHTDLSDIEIELLCWQILVSFGCLYPRGMGQADFLGEGDT
jgi:hypothetical protein